MKTKEIIDCLRRMQDIDRPVAFEVDGGDTQHRLYAENIDKGGSCAVTTSPHDYDAIVTVRDILRIIFSWELYNEMALDVSGYISGMYTVKAVRQTDTDATIILEGGAA